MAYTTESAKACSACVCVGVGAAEVRAGRATWKCACACVPARGEGGVGLWLAKDERIGRDGRVTHTDARVSADEDVRSERKKAETWARARLHENEEEKDGGGPAGVHVRDVWCASGRPVRRTSSCTNPHIPFFFLLGSPLLSGGGWRTNGFLSTFCCCCCCSFSSSLPLASPLTRPRPSCPGPCA